MIPGGKLVVDASVAIKWYVPEAESAKAVALLGRGDQLLAPDLLNAEFGNILWKKVCRGELTTDEAEAIVDAFLSASPLSLHPSQRLLRGAFDIAVAFQRSVYDSLYLALAVAEHCRLVTADEKLVNALVGTSLERFTVLLANS